MEQEFSSDIAFTPAVKKAQQRLGSREKFSRMEQMDGWHTAVTEDLATFIAERDSFYLATATAEGQPYIQHRGGPKGFLKIVDERTLAIADFKGNRQYLSLGNLSENDKAFIFLMDYAHQRRVKLWGRARFVEDDPDLLVKLADDAYQGVPQRALLFSLEAWDINCPQHITPRFTEDDIAGAVARM
ncbi:MAG: pyridoxamine 5'-phosphate oxidase [Alphaproteobacteria bacterium]|nr:pyridoxamine 5'-phosphate oxidase [Alphaproteobacteria bacterium]